MSPLCFVLMPFGIKTDASGKAINFDTVYKSMIVPAILQAGMEPIRADEEKAGGFIHKPMYERLLLCEFAIADLSVGNANVFYELGIRHAVKPHTTISIFESSARLPFDVAPLRTIPYSFKDEAVENPDAQIASLAAALKQAKKDAFTDSPIEQLVTGYKFPDLDPLIPLTEVFRGRIADNEAQKKKMKDIVKEWEALDATCKKAAESDQQAIKEEQKAVIGKLAQMQDGMQIGDEDYDVLVTMQLSYRAMSAFNNMIALHENDAFPKEIKESMLAQQQYAFALNRDGRSDDSQAILQSLLDKYGPDAETLGLLGRIYKDRWEKAMNDGEDFMAASTLDMAIETYLNGYNNDPRNYYPGINALTLIYVKDQKDARLAALLPVIKFTTLRSATLLPQDYWAKATLLELAVLEGDTTSAMGALGAIVQLKPEKWMKESTLKNINLIFNHTSDKETKLSWVKDIQKILT